MSKDISHEQEIEALRQLVNNDSDFTFLKEYMAEFDLFSYNNPLSAILSFFFIEGQIVKEYKLTKEKDEIDTRIHVFEMRPSGLGKSKGLNFTGFVLRELIPLLNQEEEMFKHEQILEWTDAALIGSIEQIKDEKTRQPVSVKICGILENASFVTCDEGSALFERANLYKQSAMNYFQTAHNTIGSPSNLLTKNLRGGAIAFNPSLSTYFVSWIPKTGLYPYIHTGFWQRQLLYIREDNINERKEAAKTDIRRVSFARKEAGKEKNLENIKKLALRFNEVRKFTKFTEFSEEKQTKQALEAEINDMFAAIETIQSVSVRKMLLPFVNRYEEQLVKIAFLSAAMRQSSCVQQKDVVLAGHVVKACFYSLMEHFSKDVADTRDPGVILEQILGLKENGLNQKDLVEQLMPLLGLGRNTALKTINTWVEVGMLNEERRKISTGKIVWYTLPKTS